ncbi:uncharacterized protein N7483_010718 [Penicillium malachiteum]|uniref:uncharacterized protein n=1 Tax=Penicillium malachiteum TaxID=1324776 RepID=UPI0025487CB5|nr:uncharacterized protein N7483_010718 [Penicillium malachiteum]KAJ5713537.1 hypothetical protein N7483_010718 [Penicillium malachiteum]
MASITRSPARTVPASTLFHPRNPRRVSRRYLGIPSAYLLDDYLPRYQLLTSVESSMKRSLAYAHLRECNLCPRKCGINRYETTGMCLIGAKTAKVNVIAPPRGEEPCIQGHHGSGSVFFSGCNLRCVFCQNHQVGRVHNINLVTPEHVVPQVALSILNARDMGLRIPIIYNTSSFDSIESLQLLDGLIDIYLPDFKLWKSSTSKRLLKAEDYPSTAMESIKEMHRQVGKEDEGREIMRWLGENVSKDLYVHIMEQYHPDAHVGKKRRVTRQVRFCDGEETPQEEVRYTEINRAVRDEELNSVKDAAVKAGLWRFCEPHEGQFHL